MQFNLTREQLEASRAKLGAQGIHIVGDKTQLSHDGVVVNVEYKEPLLNVDIVKHPFYVPQSTIESHITDWFKQ